MKVNELIKRDTRFPVEEIVRNKHQAFEFKEAVWAGDQLENDVKLFNAARQDGCFPTEAKTALMAGANPNAEIGYGLFPTSIYRATYFQCVDIVDELITSGADLNIVNSDVETPLLWVARQAESI